MRCSACEHDVPVENFWHHVGVVPPGGVPLCPPCPGCPSCRNRQTKVREHGAQE